MTVLRENTASFMGRNSEQAIEYAKRAAELEKCDAAFEAQYKEEPGKPHRHKRKRRALDKWREEWLNKEPSNNRDDNDKG